MVVADRYREHYRGSRADRRVHPTAEEVQKNWLTWSWRKCSARKRLGENREGHSSINGQFDQKQFI